VLETGVCRQWLKGKKGERRRLLFVILAHGREERKEIGWRLANVRRRRRGKKRRTKMIMMQSDATFVGKQTAVKRGRVLPFANFSSYELDPLKKKKESFVLIFHSQVGTSSGGGLGRRFHCAKRESQGSKGRKAKGGIQHPHFAAGGGKKKRRRRALGNSLGPAGNLMGEIRLTNSDSAWKKKGKKKKKKTGVDLS